MVDIKELFSVWWKKKGHGTEMCTTIFYCFTQGPPIRYNTGLQADQQSRAQKTNLKYTETSDIILMSLRGGRLWPLKETDS